MNRLSTREKILITVTVLLGFIYVFHTYYLQPLWLRYQQTQNDVKIKTAKMERLKGYDEQVLDRQIAVLEKKYQSHGDKLPDTPQSAELLYYLHEKAIKTGVELGSMQLLSTGQVTNQTVTIPVAVETSGSYDAILNFLREIETFPRLVKVSGLKWSLGEGKVMGSFQLDVYSLILSRGQKAPGPIPTADTAPADPYTKS